MLTSFEMFLVNKTYNELLFNQALYDSRGKRVLVDRPIAGWVTSCAFLMSGDYGGRFPLGGNVPPWTERLNTFANIIEMSLHLV